MAREPTPHMDHAGRIYRMLLCFYPARFRSEWGEEMLQVFHDMYQGRADDGKWAAVRFWCAIVLDTGRGGLLEHMEEWRRSMQADRSQLGRWSLRIEALLLALPLLFLTGVFFAQVWGNEALMNVILFTPQGSVGRLVTDALLVMGPTVALGLSILATVRVQIQPEDGSLMNLSLRRTNMLHYVVLFVGITILTIFGTYLFIENLPCITGYQTYC